VTTINFLAMIVFLTTPASSQTAPSTQLASAPSFDTFLQSRSEMDRQQFERYRDRLVQALDRAVQPVDQARIHLVLANAWLAIPTARPATACLLGMGTETDQAFLAHAGAQAATHLAKARALLTQHATPATHPSATRQADERTRHDDPREKELTHLANQLQPFVELWSAFGADHDPDTSRRAWAHAARELALLRESPDDNLAACARLWQAFAWKQAGRTDRAMRVLPATTAPPKTDPYDFLSRLLRCRLLADENRFPAAAALLIRIRASCAAWYPRQDDPAVDARRLLALLLEERMIRDWLTKRRNTDDSKTLDHLLRWHGEVQSELLRKADTPLSASILNQAVPLLVTIPGIGPATAPDMPPATGSP